MSYNNFSCPDPLMEEQNQYDNGWYDGIQYGLTMKDINNDIFPDENQPVLIYLNGIFISAVFRTLYFLENGEQYYQKMFITVDGKQFVPGYVRWWMPLPIIPDNTMVLQQNYY